MYIIKSFGLQNYEKYLICYARMLNIAKTEMNKVVVFAKTEMNQSVLN